MRVLIISSTLLIIFSGFYFSSFPLQIGDNKPFLTAKTLSISSYTRGELQSSLKTEEFRAEDPSFGIFRASNAEFSLREKDSVQSGRISELIQDSVTARTYLKSGVEIKQSSPSSQLQGDSFIWDQNTLLLESTSKTPVTFTWTEGKITGNSFIWDQRKGEMTLSGQVDGGLHASP